MSTYFIRVAGQVREAYPHAFVLPPFYSPEHVPAVEFDRWLAPFTESGLLFGAALNAAEEFARELARQNWERFEGKEDR